MDEKTFEGPIAFAPNGKMVAESVVRKLFDRAFFRGSFVSDKELTRLVYEASRHYDLGQMDITPLKEKLREAGFVYIPQRRGYENKEHFG